MQLFENETSQITIGQEKEKMKRDMLPMALLAEQRVVGKTEGSTCLG